MPILTPWSTPLYQNQLSDPTFGVSNIPAAGTANTKGSWVQLVAATDFDVSMIALMTNTAFFVTATQVGGLADLAIGSAGNEKVIVSNIAIGGAAVNSTFYLPIFIPKGSRIAARIQAETASRTWTILSPPLLWPYAPGHFKPGNVCRTYGSNTATSYPTAVATGASSWATPTEIAAVTDLPIRWISLSHGVMTTNVTSAASITYRVMVGSAGNEKVVVPIAAHIFANSNEAWDQRNRNFFFPVNIPAGVRLSVSGNAAAAVSEWGVALHCFA